jgi:hypothetical protein
MFETTTEQPIATKNNLCIATRADGQRCQGRALADGLCFAHSPAMQAKREAARQEGGKNRSSTVRLHNLVPPRLRPVYDKLENALSEVHDGSLSPGQAQAMGSLARAMVAVLTSGELEERVRNLEEKTTGGNNHHGELRKSN